MTEPNINNIIHEFSTGIEPEKTPDGGWISRGFTGKWMNSTLSPIPDAVAQAIRNKEFEASASSRSNPAIIGRVVQGKNNDYWSVVAVVTSGKDESRSLSVYRYFLCAGKNNLYLIVCWLEEQSSIPIFNPYTEFKKIYIQESTASDYRKKISELDRAINQNKALVDWLTKDSLPPIIVDILQLKSRYTLFQLDRLATKIAQDNDLLISWSYNVESLEKPETFLIIQPASPEAYKSVESVKYSPTNPINTIGTSNTVELKSAIQGLMKSQNIQANLKTIDNILESLKDKKATNYKADFDKIFNDLGAKDAFREKTSHHGMMELLTLRAILQPETLVEQYYLSYAQINDKPRVKALLGNEFRQQSLKFQEQLRKEILKKSSDLTNIKLKLRDGLLEAVKDFYKDKNLSIDDVLWLIGDTESVWNLGSQELVASIRKDLTQIHESYKAKTIGQIQPDNTVINNYQLWKSLINDYWKYKQDNFTPKILHEYRVLGDVFLELAQYDLAYYFYKLSIENVKFDDKILKYLKYQNVTSVFGLSTPRNERRTIIENQNNNDSLEQEIWLWLHVALYIIFFALVMTSRIRGGQNIWFTSVFGVAALLFALIYLTEPQIRVQINKHSFPLIMIMALLANPDYLMNNSANNSDQQALQNSSNTPATQSPSTNQQQPSLNIDEQTLETAIKSFDDQTSKAIKKIKTNITNDTNFKNRCKDKDIEKAFNSVIELPNDFNYKSMNDGKVNQDDPKLKELLDAIYKYQEKKKLRIPFTSIPVPIVNGKSNAIIQDGMPTMQNLEQDIKHQLQKNLTNGNCST